jgi:hypothetical protein
MKKKLFLKWCLSTMLTLVVVFLALTLGRDQADNLSVVGKIMVVVITLIYLVATIYCASFAGRRIRSSTLERFLPPVN